MFLIDCSFIARFTYDQRTGLFFFGFDFDGLFNPFHATSLNQSLSRLFFRHGTTQVESLATTDCLEQALIKPKRLKKLQPGLAIAKTRARFQRLAKLASVWAEIKLWLKRFCIQLGVWWVGLGITGDRLCKTGSLKLWLWMTSDCLHMSTVHGFVHLMATSDGSFNSSTLTMNSIGGATWVFKKYPVAVWALEWRGQRERERERKK